MNIKELQKLGIGDECARAAVEAIKLSAQRQEGQQGRKIRDMIPLVVENPDKFVADTTWGRLADALIASKQSVAEHEPVPYRVWGALDEQCRKQMDAACSIPVAVQGAVMADSHLGYGLLIGGVLACENAVVPYAVGVDISCRVQLSVIDIPVGTLEKELRGGLRRGDKLSESLQNGTRFGIGVKWSPRKDHPVLDMDWNVTQTTKAMKDRAWDQLGTSGSGNHFVEIGVLTVADDVMFGPAPVPRGQHLAILSHSGSRGVGSAVCKEYSGIARARLDKRYRDRFGNLAWLSLDTEAGQEYWAAMTLMAEYARANHAVIHKTVAGLLGAQILAVVENNHNLAWRETHGDRELIVHRKGATPAGKGVLGVIPGSMADPCFVVVGKGKPESLMSASHGAGRRMSRTEAKRRFNWPEWKAVLKQRGVRLLSAGLDEVPGSYKDIRAVMTAQTDLVDVIAEFMPRIVKMSDDGRSED